MTSAPSIAVTGLGIVSSLGRGASANWDALHDGRSGAASVTRFPTEGLATQFAATVDDIVDPTLRPTERTTALAILAMDEALEQAGHDTTDPFPGKLVVGIPPIQMEWSDRIALDRLVPEGAGDYADLIRVARDPGQRALRDTVRFDGTTRALAERLRPSGRPVTITTACSSGATAIQMGVEAIRRGEVDRALVLGADASVSPEMLLRFGLLAALSRRNDSPETASRPFDKTRDGFVPGEGAGALVLERAEVAHARGARVLGYVRGIGERLDAYHRIRQRPDAGPVGVAMGAAILDAGLAPEDISYVNAHGTATGENDRVECLGIRNVFGESAENLPVSSLKSMTGHTLSAAAAIEAAASLLMLAEQTLLPTINYTTPDPDILLDVVPNAARAAPVTHILSNSFGFGGQNVCLVLSAEP
ncbi:beta-ketoacyl synthase N-terminal-like domain-containing protein [Maritimibacter sp. UBA3975]|uniref:beta-ketoacyl synthase N-terminal-like domain-containing protein n=1 Tax=Maritimibacter sp. UBA3975 TaxID=1946833 RepID=UPI000C09EFA9|nr:beta-ketoacyl synthase N-terminal-like domain-containing protein [Maritimibacter sp. UBA3975]MAM60224.1 beta-ketoacyl-ACP synthase II [Maritimibacter sp.]|tara:strand:- start:5271 stop:6527 length:1257 start_codon:yes stop_codon:yes gene_type:complete